MTRIDGLSVVVTGAGRGIGRTLATGLAAAGASLVCGTRAAGQGAQLVQEIEADGGRAIAVDCDVTDRCSVDALFDEAARQNGGIDIVIVNAGIQGDGASLEDSDPDIWARVIATNVLGAYHTMRAAVPHLRARGAGKIIAIGSGAGQGPIANLSGYAASKAALRMLVRVLALEVACHDISINELVPGPVETDMMHSGINSGVLATMRDVEWVKDASDLLPLTLFLASQPPHGPTGQSFSLMRRPLG
jgi:3-oxoacyl-[acyl-carrier protein] reductase